MFRNHTEPLLRDGGAPKETAFLRPLCLLHLLLLVDPVDDALVHPLLVVRDGIRLVVLQPGVLPYLLQGVVLHQAAILKHCHQQVLQSKATIISSNF